MWYLWWTLGGDWDKFVFILSLFSFFQTITNWEMNGLWFLPHYSLLYINIFAFHDSGRRSVSSSLKKSLWNCRPLVNRCPQNVIGGGTVAELQHITFNFLSDVSCLNLCDIYLSLCPCVSVSVSGGVSAGWEERSGEHEAGSGAANQDAGVRSETGEVSRHTDELFQLAI